MTFFTSASSNVQCPMYYKCDLTATVHDFASEKVLITVNISNVEHVQPERVDEEDCRQQGP